MLACTLVARHAVAEAPARKQPAPSEVAAARALFAEATAAERESRWPDARRALEAALALKETPGLRFHLAYAEEHDGALVRALVDYDRADESARAASPVADDVLARVGPARAALRARVPTLALRVPDAVAGLRVTLDGASLSPTLAGRPIDVDPGAHHVVVEGDGRVAFVRSLDVAEREALAIDVELAETRAAVAKASRAGAAGAATTSNARGAVLAAEAGLAVAAVAAGAWLALAARDADARADDANGSIDAISPAAASGACRPPTAASLAAPCADLAAARDDASRDRALARAALGGAALFAAGFAATFVLWPAGERGAAPTAHVSPTGAGVAFSF